MEIGTAQAQGETTTGLRDAEMTTEGTTDDEQTTDTDLEIEIDTVRTKDWAEMAGSADLAATKTSRLSSTKVAAL